MNLSEFMKNPCENRSSYEINRFCNFLLPTSISEVSSAIHALIQAYDLVKQLIVRKTCLCIWFQLNWQYDHVMKPLIFHLAKESMYMPEQAVKHMPCIVNPKTTVQILVIVTGTLISLSVRPILPHVCHLWLFVLTTLRLHLTSKFRHNRSTLHDDKKQEKSSKLQALTNDIRTVREG